MTVKEENTSQLERKKIIFFSEEKNPQTLPRKIYKNTMENPFFAFFLNIDRNAPRFFVEQ